MTDERQTGMIPVTYDVAKDGARPGWTVTLDGDVVRHVVAFDRAHGWVEAACLGRGWPDPAHPTRKHVDPDNPRTMCFRHLAGEVAVEPTLLVAPSHHEAKAFLHDRRWNPTGFVIVTGRDSAQGFTTVHRIVVVNKRRLNGGQPDALTYLRAAHPRCQMDEFTW